MSSTPVEDAFQKAVERAKAVATKLSGNISGKRSAEDDGGATDAKRPQLSDPFGAQLAANKLQGQQQQGQGQQQSQHSPQQQYQHQPPVSHSMSNSQSSLHSPQQQFGQNMGGGNDGGGGGGGISKGGLGLGGQQLDSRPPPLTNEYGTSRHIHREVPVPPQFIGLVIGKRGESIKSIQSTTNTKVQFDSNRVDDNGCKICKISGDLENVNRAEKMIQEIIENSRNIQAQQQQQHSEGHVREHHGYDRDMNRDNRDRDRGGERGGRGGGRVGGGDRRRFEGEEVVMNVPVNRVGVIIGRGGETIRSIKQQSGCHIETDKNSKGVIIIRGPPDRIGIAQQLINEKIKDTRHNDGGPGGGGGRGGYGNRHYNPTHQQTPQHHPQQPSQPAQQQQYWPNYYYQDPSQNSTDSSSQHPNSAAWAAYYAQTQAQQMASTVPTTAGTQNGSEQPQPDYTAQWIQYYRMYGMVKEAEMIEQMAEQMKQSAQQGQPPQSQPPTSAGQPKQPPAPQQQWSAPQEQSSESYKYKQ
ncbi:far upstream element-binding protein 1-like isoform X2 [Panonychus citri]|uniref:far upstream element-binding protein 1-like isoform X2 n=1 Tax=Panonychus citri TaxID=50023 RepID=UPI002306F627|nr:far upstream element-binding protein 1-like isoform X2 [Panonychus citri]